MSKAREKLASFGHPDMNPKIKLLKTKEIKTLLGGRLAQLGERSVRNAEVGGSSPLPSTIFYDGRFPARP